MKALLEKLKLTKVESSPPPLIPRVLSSTPPPPPPLPVRQEHKPIVVLGDPIELMRQRELITPKLELKPVIGNPINGPVGVSEMVSVPVSSNGPSLSDYQNPPNLTYAGGKPIYSTGGGTGTDASKWALYPAIQNVDMAQNTFINLPQITLPVINLVGPTGTPGIMNMSDNLGASYPLDARDGNLYFDNELLAKAGDIQNISDWALYSAIGDVDMNGKKLIYSGAFVDVGSNGGTIEINSKQGSSSIYLNSQDVVVVGATTDGNSFLQTDQIANLGGAFGNVGQFLSITETDANRHITWVDKPVNVTEINPGGNTGTIDLTSSGNSITITNPTPGTINFEAVIPASVTAINPGNNTGNVELRSLAATVIITNPAPSVVNFEVPAVNIGVATLNTKSGNVVLTSADASVTIAPIPATSNVDLSVPAIAVIEGDIATLQADVVAINGEIATLQGEVGVIQGQIIGIDAELTTLTGGLAAVTTAVGVIESSYVTQVSGCKGSVQLAGTGGITISPNTGTGVITIDGSGASAGVSSINTQTGAVTLTSGNTNTLSVGSSGAGNIQLNVPVGAGGVTTFNGNSGSIILSAGTGIDIQPISGPNPSIFGVANSGVSSITTNGASPTTGIVNLVNGTGITLTPSGQNITIASTGSSGVTSLNSLTGALNVVAGSGISVTPSGSNITIANTSAVVPIWLNGGEYANPGITFSVSTNTLVRYASITTTKANAKIMIFGTFEATTSAVGTIFLTIARSTAIPTAANSTNLADRTSALTNALNGNGLSMWGLAGNTSRLTANANVVDTLATPGTYYYSIWGYDTATITSTTSELANLTILDIT